MGDITADSLYTVAGLSLGIVAVVEVLKRMGLVTAFWAGRVAAALGLVLMPLFVVVNGDVTVELLVLSIVVGAQTGLAASATYDIKTL